MAGVRWMSSNTTTKLRPVRTSLAWFVERRGLVGATAEATAGSWIASKLAMAWGAPSSVRMKSSLVRPGTGTPFLSVTTTSTVTCSTSDGKDGATEGDGCGSCAVAALETRARAARNVFLVLIDRDLRGCSRPRCESSIVGQGGPKVYLDSRTPADV
jgi:hypothetical protein